MMRFANNCMWWLVVILGQRLWKWAIMERFFEEPPGLLFIDMCTTAWVWRAWIAVPSLQKNDQCLGGA